VPNQTRVLSQNRKRSEISTARFRRPSFAKRPLYAAGHANRIQRARYAECCLNVVTATNQEPRRVQREMADEWRRLAAAIRRPRRYKQMQMG